MKKINPIKRPVTLQGLVYKKIKELLTSGQPEYGQIYSANQFAETLGVSRTPVREALLQLAAEGFLTSIQGRGFKLKELSQKEIKDFFETRKIIEAYVIERLVDGITEQDLQQLNNCLNLMIDKANHNDLNGFIEMDKNFHMQLVSRYKNRFLESIMENIRNLISILGNKAVSHEGRTQEVINEHKTILEALYQKDKKKAVKSITYHLNTTEKYLLLNF